MGEPASSSTHQDNSRASPGNKDWVLPKQLEDIRPARDFPQYRHRWNSNEEIASILIAFSKHKEWLKMEMKIRPPSGSMLLYSRNRVRYRKDGYCWKKRKDGKNIREDHMKLKVQGLECIYGSYVHSDILPTFHRRCYWLLQNPDIVLVHYLNIPYQDNTKVKIPVVPPYTLEKKEWTKEELIDQLRPMFSTGQPGEESEQMIDETVEALVKHLIEYHENANKFVKDKTALTTSEKPPRDTPCHAKKGLHPHQYHRKHAGNPSGGSSHVVHHKPDVAHVPYLLNVGGKLHVPGSGYLLVNGHGECESGHSRQGLVMPEGGGLHVVGAENNTLVSCPNVSGASVQSESTQLDYQSVQDFNSACSLTDICDSNDKLVSSVEQSMLNSCKQDFTPMQFSSESCSPLMINNNISKPEVNLVPYLKSVTAEDVQHVIRFHTDQNKVKSKGSPSELEQDPLSASFGSSDFDNLDLELHDIEKLCSFLETPDDHSSHDMAGSIPVSKNGNAINTNLGDMTKFESSNKSMSNCEQCREKSKQLSVDHKTNPRKPSSRGLVDIVDYSPEFSYTEGGSKLLVIGPWTKVSSTYTCVIDGEPVQTTLLQPGVLRCYTPAHHKGCVPVYISCDGKTLSRPVPFLYKENPEHNSSTRFSWFSVEEKDLKSLLVERLVQLEKRLTQSHYRDGPVPNLQQACESLVENDDMEGKLLWYIKMFSAGTWSDRESFPHSSKYGMTLLHLTAALGYSRVIQSLLQWRTDNPCWFLDYEVDANCLDEHCCTALMWACAKGHQQAAIVLYQWNSDTLKVSTKDGFTAMNFAQVFGHYQLYSMLHKYQASHLSTSQTAGPVNSTFPLPSQSNHDLFKQPHPNGMTSLHIQIPNPPQQQQGVLIRRQSEQDLRGKVAHKKLSKRASVDLPANYDDGRSARAGSYEYPIRETNSEPYLPMATDHPMTRGDNPMLSDNRRDIMSPDLMMNSEIDQLKRVNLDNMAPSSLSMIQTTPGFTRMDTDEVDSNESGSPIIDVERVSSDDESYCQQTRSKSQSISSDSCEDVKHQMVTLAKQIIAAMPERIKLSPSRDDGEPERERCGSYSSLQSQSSLHTSSYEEDSGISTPMGDAFAFDEYRYPDLGTPASSLSPDSTCMPSPYSPYSFTLDSPPPTTEDFTEYFNAPTTFMEKDFSQLTLSDKEQRKLYEAAKVIQKTYRQYRDKQQLQQQQQKEIEAAVLIQKYYRRYKQYAYYKKMTQAAVLIQSQFRSYYAQKRFKKSRDAAVVIQNQYRTYKEHERLKKGGNKSVIIQQRYRSHYQRKNVKGQSTEDHAIPVIPDSNERIVMH
ncbi:calmodulin-binding transcription activator 1-like isoform X3 [Ostrea edulis]|uniref:calmodulin-binding transcription activator 1-like isoform X3 n=1 Tax=Ostrea edulis TaxID=37623 RepID=UPI002094D93B|nr:calmodulin-binding transcription activator 1-like isoform X3 [Ostrea edulis]